MYIITDDSGRITVASMDTRLYGGVQIDISDGFDIESAGDWVLRDGALVYDPQKRIENNPTNAERISALENQLAAYEAAYVEGVQEA